MTVDVEDYYQVSAFEDVVDRSTWDTLSRGSSATRARCSRCSSAAAHGTFFTPGGSRIAARRLRDIRDQGHEIASHGYEHRLVGSFTPATFRDDLRRTSDAIEKACGARPRLPRRRSAWADALGVRRAARRGLRSRAACSRCGTTATGSVVPLEPVVIRAEDGRTSGEFPMTTVRLLGRNLPVAGGGWMRLLPGAVMRGALRARSRAGVPTIVYLHPWEVDPDQPRVQNIGRMSRFRHYLNLDKTSGRLLALMRQMRFGTVSEALGRLSPTSSVIGRNSLRTLK
jgi:peptidoglycan/xylan/chitin deacetylase (PgdA/CDA1 family)